MIFGFEILMDQAVFFDSVTRVIRGTHVRPGNVQKLDVVSVGRGRGDEEMSTGLREHVRRSACLV